MTFFVIMAALAFLIYTGWKLTSRNAYESAEYTVLKSDGDFELREYPELMLASTEMKSRQGNDGSFGRLFNYISGSNAENQKLSMTTPVFIENGSSNASGKMGFVIPKQITETRIPRPDSERVELVKRPAGVFATIRFSGRDDQQTVGQKQALLEQWIQTEGYVVEGEPEFAGYDPPWTPGPFRRNEILIRIREESPLAPQE